MKQTNSITRDMTQAQEEHAAHTPILYRLYTEDTGSGNVPDIVGGYFPGFTCYPAVGSWQGASENTIVVDILGTLADLQKVIDCAGDIRVIEHQSSVLLVWSRVESLNVCDPNAR